jgi:hypothetical protein
MWSAHLLATWISSILLELVMEHPRVSWLIWHGFGTYCHLFMIYEEFSNLSFILLFLYLSSNTTEGLSSTFEIFYWADSLTLGVVLQKH